MEQSLKNFEVEYKNPSEETLRNWRQAVTTVKNPRRRFRMVADLDKRAEAERIKRSIQEKIRVASVVKKEALKFLDGIPDVEREQLVGKERNLSKEKGDDLVALQLATLQRKKDIAEDEPLRLREKEHDQMSQLIVSSFASPPVIVQINEKTTEWALLIASLLLEGISATFEQLGYALMGMVMAFLALLLSIIDLIRKARKVRNGRSLLPRYSHQSSHNSLNRKPGLVEYFGLVGAVWQCSYSTIQYYYTRRNLDNPIKMCLLPFIFALCVVISKLVKSSSYESLLNPKVVSYFMRN